MKILKLSQCTLRHWSPLYLPLAAVFILPTISPVRDTGSNGTEEENETVFLNQPQCHIRENENNAFKVQGINRECDSNMRRTAVLSSLILHTHPGDIYSRPVSYYRFLQTIWVCVLQPVKNKLCVIEKTRESCVFLYSDTQILNCVWERINGGEANCCTVQTWGKYKSHSHYATELLLIIY